MKILHKLIRCALAVCMAAQLLAIPAFAADDKEIYLALGDSISTGYGLDSSNKGFVNLLSAQLPGYTVENKSLDGNTAEGIYKQLTDPSDANYVSEDLLTSADIITITCGGNDMMDFMYGVILKAYNDANPSAPITDINEIKETIKTDIKKAATLIKAAKSAVKADLVESAGYQNAVTAFHASLTDLVDYIRSKNPTAMLVFSTQYHPYQVFSADNLTTSQKVFFNFIHTAITPCLALTPAEKDVCTHISEAYSCGCGENCSNVNTCPNRQAEYSYEHVKYSCGCGKNCSEPDKCSDRQAEYPRCSKTAPLKTLNSVIVDNATHLGYVATDVYTAFDSSESKGKDYCNAYLNGITEVDLDFHPNAAGHEVIAETLWDTIQTTLDTSAPVPAIVSSDLSKGTVTFRGTNLYAFAAVAFYDSDNRMVGYQMQAMNGTESQTTLKATLRGTPVEGKVFLFSRGTLIPDCGALTILK